MKRIVRKIFAFVLAMVLCITQLALPAMANTTVVDNPDGSTTTTTVTTTINSDGSSTTVTDSSTQNMPGGASNDTVNSTTTSNTETTVGYSDVHTTDKNWTEESITKSETSSSDASGSTGPADPNASTTTSKTSETTKESSVGEESVVTTYDFDSAAQRTEGKEDVDIDIEVKDEDKTTNTELSESSFETEIGENKTGDVQDNEKKQLTENEFILDDADKKEDQDATVVENNAYTGEKKQVGNVDSKDINQNTVGAELVLNTPQGTYRANGTFTRDDKNYDYQEVKNHSDQVVGYIEIPKVATASVEVKLDPKDVAEGNFPDDGATVGGYTVKHTRDTSGKLTGYTLTKVTSHTDNNQGRTQDEIVATNGGYQLKEENVETKVDPADYVAAGSDYFVSGPVYENGVQVGTKVVTPIIENGATVGYEIRTIKTEKVDYDNVTTTDNTRHMTDVSLDPSKKPADGSQTDAATGVTTSWVVEDVLNDAGEIVGYKKTSTMTDADGVEIATSSQIEYYTAKPTPKAPYQDANGNTVTETIEDILDTNGNLVGYKTVLTTTNDNQEVIGESSIDAFFTTGSGKVLPEKPVVDAAVPNAYGGYTYQQVEDITDPATGEVIGYKTVRTIQDKDGNTVGHSSDSIYLTDFSVTSEIVETADSKEKKTTTVTKVYGKMVSDIYERTDTGYTEETRTLDQDEYTLVYNGDELLMIVSGEVYAVDALAGHGTIDNMTARTPNMDWEKNQDNDLRGASKDSDSSDIDAGYQWEYIGNGLRSSLFAHTTGTNLLGAHQFKIRDKDNNVYYVYCADLDVDARKNYSFSMDNVKDAGYVTAAKAERIESIAVNGYWGNVADADGDGNYDKGSLESVKELLKREIKADRSKFSDIITGVDQMSDSEIDTLVGNLSHGMALTATQCAIWKYGDSVTSGTDNTALETGNITERYQVAVNNYPYYKNGDLEPILTQALYKALTTLDMKDAQYATESRELLDEENFATQVKMNITSKVTASDLDTFKTAHNYEGAGAVNNAYSNVTATDNNGVITYTENGQQIGNLYKADLSFTVTVEEKHLTGNLEVSVIGTNGRVIAKAQIGTDKTNILGEIFKDNENDDFYTFKDLILPEGEKVTLTLTGTQDMTEGAYLYTATNYRTAQTFVGVATGERTVNLAVEMKFEVDEPNLEKRDYQWEETDRDNYTRTNTFADQDIDFGYSTNVYVKTTVMGTKVHTKTVNQKTMEKYAWDSYFDYLYTTVNDEDGGGGGGEVDDGLNIPDEAVPLAAAPKTGDASQILAIVCLVSMAGAWLLSKKEVQY